jgi:hypothetical protein
MLIFVLVSPFPFVRNRLFLACNLALQFPKTPEGRQKQDYPAYYDAISYSLPDERTKLYDRMDIGQVAGKQSNRLELKIEFI